MAEFDWTQVHLDSGDRHRNLHSANIPISMMKRRFVLTLSGVFVAIFLFIYFLINFATPNDGDRKPSFMNLQNQMQELEKDFRRHGNRMQSLIEQLQRAHERMQDKIPSNQIEQQPIVSMGSLSAGAGSHFSHSSSKNDQNLELLAKPLMSAETNACREDFQQVPKPDIQVRGKGKIKSGCARVWRDSFNH